MWRILSVGMMGEGVQTRPSSSMTFCFHRFFSSPCLFGLTIIAWPLLIYGIGNKKSLFLYSHSKIRCVCKPEKRRPDSFASLVISLPQEDRRAADGSSLVGALVHGYFQPLISCFVIQALPLHLHFCNRLRFLSISAWTNSHLPFSSPII